MLTRNKSYEKVYGLPGASFEQECNGKKRLFNNFGLEVEMAEDQMSVIVIEQLPENMSEEEALIEPIVSKPKPDGPLTFDDTRNSTLTVHERIRIADEKDPNYMSEDDIKSELTGRNVSFHKLMGRKKLAAILQLELGG
jgi:hypothetical protein